VGLGDYMQRRLADLSDEQAPKVALARAVVMHPSLLLFPDDVDFELDEHMLHEIWRDVQDLRRERNITIFLTPHSIEEAGECDRVAVLAAGRLAAYDTPAGLKEGIGRDCIEIRTADPDALLHLLRERCGLQGRGTEGVVQLTTEDAAGLIPRLIAECSLVREDMAVRPTTLEDVCHFAAQATAPAETKALSA
jgi:ABC-2 type transport system ATP-binding protein